MGTNHGETLVYEAESPESKNGEVQFEDDAVVNEAINSRSQGGNVGRLLRPPTRRDFRPPFTPAPAVRKSLQTAPQPNRSNHQFAFNDFFATYRGRRLTDHPQLDPAKIQSFGFLIADNQEGAFSLEIDWIGAY